MLNCNVFRHNVVTMITCGLEYKAVPHLMALTRGIEYASGHGHGSTFKSHYTQFELYVVLIFQKHFLYYTTQMKHSIERAILTFTKVGTLFFFAQLLVNTQSVTTIRIGMNDLRIYEFTIAEITHPLVERVANCSWNLQFA